MLLGLYWGYIGKMEKRMETIGIINCKLGHFVEVIG